MNKILLLAACTVLSTNVYAQQHRSPVKSLGKPASDKQISGSGFYIKVGAGYAMPHAGQTTNTYGYPYNGNATYQGGSSFSSFEVKNASFAAGVQANIGMGYNINKNIGVELGLLAGLANKKYKSDNTFPNASSQIHQNITIYAKTPLFLTPSAVLQSGGKKLNIYSRAGIAIPLNLKIVQEFNEESTLNGTTQTDIYNVDFEQRMKFNIGFTGAVGGSLKVSKYTHIWLEGALFSMSAFVKDQTITKYVKNGVNYLSYISAANRKSAYSKSTSGSNDPTYSYPFSSFGINAGVTMDL